MPASTARFTAGVRGAASNGEMSSRSTFWVTKLSTCEVCVLSLPAPSAMCSSNCGVCAAIAVSSLLTCCRYGSALLAWEKPITYLSFGPHALLMGPAARAGEPALARSGRASHAARGRGFRVARVRFSGTGGSSLGFGRFGASAMRRGSTRATLPAADEGLQHRGGDDDGAGREQLE